MIIIGIGIVSIISLFSFKMGIIGSIIRGTTFSFMGFGSYFFPLVIILVGITFILDNIDLKEKNIILSMGFIFLSMLILLDGINPFDYSFLDRMDNAIELSKIGKGGGLIGSFFGFFFYRLFGAIGSYLVLMFIVIINLLIITNVKIKDIISIIGSKSQNQMNKKRKPKIVNDKEPKQIKEDIHIKDSSREEKKNLIKEIKEINFKDESNNLALNTISEEIESKKEKTQVSTYDIPSLSLLKLPTANQDGNDKKEILNNAKIIEETMRNFGIDATINQINKGPTITCYELQPSPGIKLSKIVSLSDNIALSLASSDIRIEAPIPGKSVVGIEVPNKAKSSVLLREIIMSEAYNSLDSQIPLALGKDVSGNSVVSTIDKMPHLLIAGATGSGKSVCINTIIMSILYKSSPADVKLLLIDPKVVELNIYNGIPHLLIPVVTDAKKASFALNWAVEEMEKRYKLFAQNNVRDISSYNNKVKENGEEKLPMIVIIIDELADLMMVAAQEIEDYICRLAQMARAAGMYLIVATQRPSVDVITGTIKANIPSRISFAVSSQIDSRTILDMSGAEKLLGKGDMLFYPSFYSKPVRLQGAFISDEEVESVVNALKAQDITEYDEDIIEVIESPKEIQFSDSDELLPKAIELVVEEGQASISLLQRKLKIGYARAARIVDEMEERGVVGGYEGSKPRKVLLSPDDLDLITKER
ncbi:DNA translocase FtsK [Tissierella sp. MB52-C2]|uniref:DNA translocase FtsK n=1 Tax=Tissierella sp. MB52-C2 TaxID=3070999 RepID=UPI00280B976E|nr:DNA translocase FtsK [Tissierella sp. MB52-C2]WMM26553.1 DNA translocase FtsK [Tissierella sp. MB52-C2]